MFLGRPQFIVIVLAAAEQTGVVVCPVRAAMYTISHDCGINQTCTTGATHKVLHLIKFSRSGGQRSRA